MSIPTYGPRCPNHGEFLEGIGFPMPKKGTGICPVSKCPFDFEIETDEATMVVDKNGEMQKKVGWSVNGEENNS